MIDILFISPGNANGIYQNLADNYAAIEPPTWALLLAQSCRSIGYTVALIDINAEQLNKEEVEQRVKELNPRLICFVVYGEFVFYGRTSLVSKHNWCFGFSRCALLRIRFAALDSLALRCWCLC